MNMGKPFFHYARVTLEAVTPHGIQSGRGDATHDVLLVRDCNNLPALPATSIAGVLRHLYTREFGAASANELFGFVQGDTGSSSALQFSWGLIHDQNNRPVEGIQTDIHRDPVLEALCDQKPVVRQRVRLNARGAAVNEGKYDVTLVPAGARYTCFIGLWSEDSTAGAESFDNLLGLLRSPLFRLGHGTRTGQGSFRVESLHHARWDLRTKEGRSAFIKRPRSRTDTTGLNAINLKQYDDQICTCELNLKAEAGWRIGGGEQPLSPVNETGRFPDLLPQSEMRISWTGTKGHLQHKQVVLPASAIKGALAHRTVFHWRCLEELWSEGEQSDELPEPLHPLFGSASSGTTDTGTAGNVIIDDCYIEHPRAYTQMHNRIDHFTGGVIRGALFEEELLWKTPVTITVRIKDSLNLSPNVLEAFKRSLEDLAEGWLPLGAGGARGQGVFTGNLKWFNTEQVDATAEAS